MLEAWKRPISEEERRAQTQEALAEAYDWMQDWYKAFREKTGLSVEVIKARIELAGRFHLPETITLQTEKGPATYKIVDLDRNMETDFGAASRIRLVQASPGSVPVGEPAGMMVLTPVGDFSQAKCMSSGWRFDESEITYLNLNSSGGKIARVVQITRPGVLFEVSSPNGRHYSQILTVNFSYQGDSLTGWSASLGEEDQISGRRENRYSLQNEIDMAKIIRNIISQKPAITRQSSN